MRLKNFDQKYSNYMARMVKKAFVIFLSLENIDQISALKTNTSNIRYIIFSFFFMIWGVRNFKVLLVSLIIDLHESKFRKAVLKSNSVKSDAPYLNSDWAFSWSSCIYLLEILLFDYIFSHSFLHMCIPLWRLLLSKFLNFKGSQDGCNWNSQWI